MNNQGHARFQVTLFSDLKGSPGLGCAEHPPHTHTARAPAGPSGPLRGFEKGWDRHGSQVAVAQGQPAAGPSRAVQWDPRGRPCARHATGSRRTSRKGRGPHPPPPPPSPERGPRASGWQGEGAGGDVTGTRSTPCPASAGTRRAGLTPVGGSGRTGQCPARASRNPNCPLPARPEAQRGQG